MKLISGKKTIEVGLSIVDNRTIRKLNHCYRKEDRETDVLSFTINETLPRGSYFLGDIAVSLDQIKKQAKKYHVSEAEELARVVAHGVLHLLGYEDERRQDKAEMKKTEDRAVKQIFRKK